MKFVSKFTETDPVLVESILDGFHTCFENIEEYSDEARRILNDPELCAEKFIQYYNDFLTIERFASYHGYTMPEAYAIVRKGKEDHNRMAEAAKAAR
jgi:hypothetical protein